jgi:hypothetical protein
MYNGEKYNKSFVDIHGSQFNYYKVGNSDRLTQDFHKVLTQQHIPQFIDVIVA